MSDTMQNILAERLTAECAAWGISDARIAANAMARLAMEALLEPTAEMCVAAYEPQVDGPAPMFRAMMKAGLNPSPTPTE